VATSMMLVGIIAIIGSGHIIDAGGGGVVDRHHWWPHQ